MNFIDITIRREQTVLHKEVAQVPDSFADELLGAYRAYYPDATDETQVFQRICRGLIEGIMANIHAAQNAPPPPPTPVREPMQFRLESEPEPAPEPPSDEPAAA